METKKITYNDFYMKYIIKNIKSNFAINKHFNKNYYKLNIYALSQEPKTLDEFKLLNSKVGDGFDDYYRKLISEGLLIELDYEGIKYVGLHRDIKKSGYGNYFDFDANTLLIMNGEDNFIHLQFYNNEEKILVTMDYSKFKKEIKESKLKFCGKLMNKPKNLRVDLV